MSQSSDGELSPLKKALLAVQTMKAKLGEVKAAQREPVAIVGAGCRFPGGVRDLDSYWRLLAEGTDAVREVPPERWDIDDWYDADPAAPGKMVTREAGFLDDVAGFDAAFFGISPREALDMDPAQRLLLMVAWEALENANTPPERLSGTRTGVYVGLGLSDYGRRHFLGPDPTQMTAYSGTGAFLSVAAGRISYALGLEGPAVTVDTACSSSLVSLHLAVQSLRTRESDVALAGGANLILSPEPTVYFSKLQAMAPDGRCKTFDARADGYVRAEGAGLVVLKRLSDAQRDGDRILAVIRGSAVNQDGRSNGLTAPSGRAQAQVIRASLDNAGLTPDAVGYIEAHGTGTPLGDPIELDALKTVFGQPREDGSALFVGSVKTNFGHAETAAGVAGVLKLVACLRHGQIPPHLHLTEVNPRIRLDGTPLQIATALTPWDGPKVAGVSSFGLSGTNAHLVLEAPPSVEASPTPEPVSEPVWCLSARSEAALRGMAAALADRLDSGANATEVAGALLRNRQPLAERLALSGPTSAALRAVAEGTLPEAAVRARAEALAPSVVFLFTGQGSQFPGMGRDLYASEPVFRAEVDRVAEALADRLDAPLTEVMFGEDDRIHDTRWTQPCLYALQVGLAALWSHHGVVPEAVIGHSIGEYAAAVVAGVMSVEDGARLVEARGRLMSELPREGAMIAVFAPESALADRVAETDGIDVAGVNTPTETVVSGRTDGIEAVEAWCAEQGIETRRLRVSHAFHSPCMEPMLGAFEAEVASVALSKPTLPLIANLDGQPVAGRATDPAYWRDHVRHAVRFAAGLQTLAGQGHALFVELGPRPVLSSMGARSLEDAHFVPSLHPDQPDRRRFRTALGGLWAHGVEVRWGDVQPEVGRHSDLPSYAWDLERYWLDPVPSLVGDSQAGLLLETRWRTALAEPAIGPTDWHVVGPRADEVAAELVQRGHRASAIDASDAGGAQVQVVDLRGLDASMDSDWIAGVWDRAVAWLTGGAARWHVVSQGVTSGSAAGVASAGLWGLARVAGLEASAHVGHRIDLGENWTASALVDALLRPKPEAMRLDDGPVRVARLVPSRRATSGGALALGEGAVLVTGGLGALGRRITEWVVSQGAQTVVLTGRSGAASDEAQAWVASLEAQGVTVHVVAADVGTAEGAARALGAAPIQGIIHAAGASKDASLGEQDRSHLEVAWAGKARGAWHLHQAAGDVDFFVLLSSAAGTLGVPGQANYAAANASLDALARHRHRLGLPATSLAYGPWDGAGMASRVSDGVRAVWDSEGIRPLDPVDALDVLAHAAGGPVACALVAPFDWVRYVRTRPEADPLLAELVPSTPAPAAQGGTATGWAVELRAVAPESRRAALVDRLQGVAGQVLGLPEGRRLPLTQGFFEAGLDSLMATDLRNRVQEAAGVALSPTVAFDHPNLDRLASHVLDAMDLGASAGEVERVRVDHRSAPIAIVGMGCRFPHGATDPDAFWSLLRDGVDGITEVPRDRYDVQRYFDPSPATPGKLYSRWGGFVDGIEDFDPGFFGISPREATSLDPQQRLLLEVSWEALEDAAIAPSSLEGTATGVYVGIGGSEYGRRFDPLLTTGEVDAYSGTGNESSFAAGRVSYCLGLQGPALSINTACSSSLVTVHMACQALRSGDCDVALAGGVNAIVGPETTVQLSQLRALAPDGRCKTFDHRANGYVRGEGCGMIVLKRLDDAVRDGDRVLALVQGSAINHDGRSSGLTVPNGLSQQQVVRAALQDGGVEPGDVDYIECHGTGTSLGDPIEVHALRAVLGTRTDRPVRLGSVKTNVGHLEAGAGIAGLLKVVLSLQHQALPPHLHFEQANDKLELGELGAEVPTALLPWAREARPRMAGISSFGISGTNAHVLVGDGPERAAVDVVQTRPAHLLPLSGRSEGAVRDNAARLAAWLEQNPGVELADVAVTLGQGRSHHAYRAAVVATDAADARAQLQALAQGGPVASSTERPRLVFLCTGAGPQVVGMARELYETEPVFRAALDEAATHADPHLETPLLEAIFAEDADASPLNELAYTQPAMFALEWAMAQMLAAWGIRPDAVIGHSTGQYIAACLAGVMDLPEGIALMAQRAAMMSSLPHDGSMVAVLAPVAAVEAAVEAADGVDLAAVNGPEEAVISGLAAPVQALADQFEADGIEVRRLRISHAAHSNRMDPILNDFEALVAGVTLQPPRIPLVENVRGAVIGDELAEPAYWRRHMREGVRFFEGMQTLQAEGYTHFVEIGNHPVLCGAGGRSIPEAGARWFPMLRRNHGEWAQVLETVARLYTSGVDLDWASWHAHQTGQRIALPTYAFQRKRHWVDHVAPSSSVGAVGRDWLYRNAWQPWMPGPAAASQGAVLLLCDAGDAADRLVEQLDRPVVRVRRGAELGRDGDDWIADPTDSGQLATVLISTGPSTVVSLLGLDAGEVVDDPISVARDPAQTALALLHAAARNFSPDLVLVTRGAHPVADEPVRLAGAPVWGLGQVAAIELPDLRVQRIDVPSEPNEADWSLLARVIEAGHTEDAVVLRDGSASVPRLVPAADSPAETPIRGTWWITGGLGALGLRIAGELLDRGAEALVLTGRSAPSEDAEAQLERWREAGKRVDVVRGDVSDSADVARMWAEVNGGDRPEVRGVVHGAGVLEDGMIAQLDWARFESVWGAKIAGAWALHQATAAAELDAFVLLSSAASMIGSAGQSNYAAANAFLDALAHHRRGLGLPGTSQCWGPWGDAGLAVEARRQWEKGGVRPLVPAQGVSVLCDLVAARDAQVAIVDLDWRAFADAQLRVPTLIADRVPAVQRATVAAPLRVELDAAPATQRSVRLTQILGREIGAVLGISGNEIDPAMGFFDAGMDSLMAVEVSTRLKEGFGVALPATVAFDHPSLASLVDHLLGSVLAAEAASAAPVVVAPIASDQPMAAIAVVGLSCRMPGGANSPEAFWELLRSGTDGVGPVPADRWDLSEYYDPTPGTPGKMYAREAGFIDHVDVFDPEFFGISPREAASMDPQQRLLLEVSWEALERAGRATEALHESPTAVFVGVGDSGYLQRFQQPGGELYADTYAGTGNLSAFVSGRIAYALGLHGPNLALNTACSSSLVAAHLGVQALRSGECDMALVGGVHLMLSPENFVYVSQLKALSPDGRCKTFDARADGYGRSEGCAMLALRRLEDAQRDGDPVLAVIRGSAVGHDGPSSGLTVPNGAAQRQVLQQALARSGVQPLDVSYIEAHGTGTVLGDPIEVHAIEAVYGQGRTSDRPLHLGAVKSNVGHMEVAAGAASLAKMVLTLQHRTLPPNLHFDTPNPDIDLDQHHLVVDTEARPWEVAEGQSRIAGISSFGLAGTNAHVLMEEAPEPPREAVGPTRPAQVLTLSTRDPKALQMLAGRMAERLRDGVSLPALAASAQLQRRSMPHRLAMVGTDSAHLADRLEAFAQSGDAEGAIRATASIRPPRVAFLFSGQGSQSPGMGRALYEAEPVYRAAVDRCAAVVDTLRDVPLLEVLHGDDARVHDTEWTQPCLFAVEYGLACLWRSWGVEPDAVIGHSIGELVAAAVAGVMGVEDALRLVCERGRMMGELPREGAMLAVFAEPEALESLLAAHAETVGVAAINNPGETVLSGRTEAIEALEAALAERDIQTRRLTVSHAFHSPLMEPMLDAFGEVAASMSMQAPTLPLVSNLTGSWMEEAPDAAYWQQHVRQGVRFADGLRTLDDMAIDVFIELGPHTALLGMGRRTLTDRRNAAWVGSLRRDEPEWETLLAGLGRAWAHGARVAWPKFLDGFPQPRVDVPTYPWQKRRLWFSEDEFPGRKSAHANWLLEEVWRPVDRNSGRTSGQWSVLGEGPEVEAIRAALVARGAESAGPIAGVIDCRPLSWAGVDPDAHVSGLWDVAQRARRCEQGHCAVVTRGAVAADGGLQSPSQGAAWGLFRVVALEHPTLTVRSVDVDPEAFDAEAVVDAILGDEPEVAIRGGALLGRRLSRASGTGAGGERASTILITGGLGGLGLELAKHLASEGAEHLVLTSRRERPEHADAIAAMEAGGTQVTVALGDVGKAEDVQRIVDDLGDRKPGMVVHAAGVIRDGMLANQDEAQFGAPFQPKLHGAWNLHQALPEADLLLFSGGASLLGSPGQANYSTANAFLDAFAHWRTAQGARTVAVNWGAWAEVGMAAGLGDKHAERQAREGIHRIPLAVGMGLVERLMDHPSAQVGVLNVNWDTFVQTMHGGTVPPLLSELVAATPQGRTSVAADEAVDGSSGGLPPLLAEVQGASDASAVVQAHVHGLALRVLDLPRDRVIDPEQPLLELGLDSLLAVELKNAIMDSGVDIPVARVMTGPPILAITQLVLQKLDEMGPIGGADAQEVGQDRVLNEWTTAKAGTAGERYDAIHPVWVFVAGVVFATVLILGGYLAGQATNAPDVPASSAQTARP